MIKYAKRNVKFSKHIHKKVHPVQDINYYYINGGGACIHTVKIYYISHKTMLP